MLIIKNIFHEHFKVGYSKEVSYLKKKNVKNQYIIKVRIISLKVVSKEYITTIQETSRFAFMKEPLGLT